MPRERHHPTDVAARIAGVLFAMTGCVGCTALKEQPPPPPVLVSAVAALPVGEVLPVFIEVVGPHQSTATAYREDVCALDPNGKCVAALDLEEAGQRAGGMEKLAAAVAHDESALTAVGRSVLMPSVVGTVAGAQAGSQVGGQGGAGLLMLGTAAGVTTGLARGTYVAASPEARYLDQVSLNSLASRTKWYWNSNCEAGFVYFPAGKYRRIRVMTLTEKSIASLWLDWPEGSEKTFDMQPSEPLAQAPSQTAPPPTDEASSPMSPH